MSRSTSSFAPDTRIGLPSDAIRRMAHPEKVRVCKHALATGCTVAEAARRSTLHRASVVRIRNSMMVLAGQR
jgi:hypothetical protein